MMPDSFKIIEKREGIDTAPARFREACKRGTYQVMERGVIEVKKESPSSVAAGKHGGEGGISYTVVDKGGNIIGELSAVARDRRTGVNYLYFIVKGTGLFGPRKKRIVPLHARVLAWMEDGSELPTTDAGWAAAIMAKKVVFRRSVKGQRPNDFISRGMKTAMKEGPKIFNREIEKMNREVR